MSERTFMPDLEANASEMLNDASKAMASGRVSAATTLSNAASAIDERVGGLPGGRKVEDLARGAADKIAVSAEYLRSHDSKAMMSDVEALVKSHPGRSLLVAVFVGFFAGWALRDRD